MASMVRSYLLAWEVEMIYSLDLSGVLAMLLVGRLAFLGDRRGICVALAAGVLEKRAQVVREEDKESRRECAS